MKLRSYNFKPKESREGRVGARTATFVAAASLLLAGCSSDSKNESTAAVASDPQVVDVLVGTLNYDGLTSKGVCQGGAPRPCFAPIRTEPKFIPEGQNPFKNYMNPGEFTLDANGDRVYTSISWPYEGVDEESGDELKIVCRVEGEDVHGVDPSIHSNVWDVVVIPAEVSLSGAENVGYVPERWMQLPPNLLLDDCPASANPANAPVATTPTS